MGLRRIATDLREVQANLSELLSENTAEEKAASKQLAESARRFSRNTRAVVDDKLSFSATLMRAGEVGAATRLLEEVEHEVRSEEAALIEVVNEVKVASSSRRDRITRLRLARALVASLLGFSLLAFSAVGMAVAGVFKSRESQEVGFAPYDGGLRHPGRGLRVAASETTGMRRLKIADMNLLVTASQFRKIIKLTDGTVDDQSISDLMQLLPDGLAQKIQDAIDTANATVATIEETVPVVSDSKIVEQVRKEAAKETETASEEAGPASDETEATPNDDATDEQDSGTEDSKKGGGDKSDEDGDGGETPPAPQSFPIRP
jgi:hypothetical protein